MIVAIADLMGSRDLDANERRRMDREIRGFLAHINERFSEHTIAMPSLTQGDSIELLVNSWQPIVFLIHKLLMDGVEFRIGLGTGDIIILKEKSDDCDGPAFWNAREALRDIKESKYTPRAAGFKFAAESSSDERNMVINTILLYATLKNMTTTQLRYCFLHLWEEKRVVEIAEATGASKGNVSKVLSKTPCYLLKDVMTYLS